MFWLKEGVDGVQLSGVERVAGVVPSLWTDIRAIVQNGTDERPNKRSETKQCYWDQVQLIQVAPQQKDKAALSDRKKPTYIQILTGPEVLPNNQRSEIVDLNK